MNKLINNTEYKELVQNIGHVYQNAKSKVISTVNSEMLIAYWNI